VCAPVAATPSRPADVPLAPALAPITPPPPTFASMAPPAPVQRSRRRSRSRQRSPRADAHVPRSRRRPIASLAAVMAAAAAGGGKNASCGRDPPRHRILTFSDTLFQGILATDALNVTSRMPLTSEQCRLSTVPRRGGVVERTPQAVCSQRPSTLAHAIPCCCRRHGSVHAPNGSPAPEGFRAFT